MGIAKEAFESVNVVNADDPAQKFGDIGPLASKAQFDKVTGYIKKGLAEGARLVTGGLERPLGTNPGGYFVRPTVFADVTHEMAIAQEEIFGPVLVWWYWYG